MQQSNRSTKQKYIQLGVTGAGLLMLTGAGYVHYLYRKNYLLKGNYKYRYQFSDSTIISASCLFLGGFYRYQTQSHEGRQFVQRGRYKIKGNVLYLKRHDGDLRTGILNENHSQIDLGDDVVLKKNDD